MNHRRRRQIGVAMAALLVLTALGAVRAPAETPPRPPPKTPPLPPPAPPQSAPEPETGTAPPYEADLEHLAELLGTLAYLRDLCGKGDGAEWRAKMTALLDAEAKTQDRRERLAGAYNRGFRDYQVMHRTCTASSEVVISRCLDEGDRLTRDLSSRFGGN